MKKTIAIRIELDVPEGSKVSVNGGPSPAKKDGNGKAKPATEKQRKMLADLAKTRAVSLDEMAGKLFLVSADRLTISQASAMIEKLLATAPTGKRQ